MGRFYQTTEAKYVDNKMFEAPHQLMAQVLQNKDKEIDTEISSANAYLDKLKAEVLIQDSPQLQEKIKEYEGRISGITNGIRSNPLNYGKFSGDIQQLGRDVNAEWTTGKVGQMQQNKKFYDKRLEQIAETEKADKGGNTEYYSKQRESLLKDYQQGIRLNSSGKSENNIEQYGTLYKDTVEQDFESKMKATKTGWEKTSNGGAYFYNNEGTKEVLTREELGDEFINWAKASPQSLAAINDYSKVGVTGYKNGDINNAKIIQKDKNGKETLVNNPDNYWGKKAISAGDAKINNTSSKKGISVNSHYEWETNRADTQKASMEALGATTEQIKLEGKIWLEANTTFLNGIKDFGEKHELPKDYNAAQPMRSLQNYANSVKTRYGKDAVKYKEVMLDLQKVYNLQQTVADKGFGVLIPKYGVEVTKQIMLTAQNLDKNPQTVNLMVGTAQRFNPSTNKFEPIYDEGKVGDKYATYGGRKGNMYYKLDKEGNKILMPKTSNQKELSLLELTAHPEKYGLKAEDFNVQAVDDTEDPTGEDKNSFKGTEKNGKHTPNYYVPNSLQPYYIPGPDGKPKGYYTYDLDINGKYFRMTTPMEKFNIVAGVNVK